MTGGCHRPSRSAARSRDGRAAGLILFLLLLVAAVAIPPAGAVEISLAPSATLTELLSDNLRMATEGHKVVWGSVFSPGLRWGADTELLEVRGEMRANLQRYIGEEELSADDTLLALASRYKLEQRRVGVNGTLVRDSTWTSEVRETGLVLAARRRRARTVDGFWEESLTERVSIRSGYQRADARYAGEGEGLFDYRTQTGKIDLTMDLSERGRATVGGYFLGYQAPSARIRSIDAGVQAGLTRAFSETVQATLLTGVRQVITTSSFGEAGFKDRSWGILGDLEVEKEFEAGRWRGGVGRRINPSGSGSLIQADRLFTSAEREMTEQTGVSIAINGYRNRALRTGSVFPTESFAFNVEPAWRWRWTERWSMYLSYRYAWQKERNAASADSHTVAWQVEYEGLKWIGGVEGVSAR